MLLAARLRLSAYGQLPDMFLTANRSSLAPILLEALLFLRMNRDLWNAKTVMEARQAVKDEAKDERLMKKLAELNEDVDGEAVDIEEDEDE